MTDLPTITVSLDLDTGTYRLMVTSYNMIAPAGPRLFRAPPHPDIRFTHDSEAAAEKDAAVLREYIARTWGAKHDRKKARKMGAD